MLSYSALSSTILPMSAGIYRMKLKSETRVTARNARTMSVSSEINLTYSTDTKKVYKDRLQYIAPLRETLNTCNVTHLEDQLQQAVKKIKRIMTRKLSNSALVEELIMIDTIQRLGLEFYFQDDIHAALEKRFESHSSMEGADTLHGAALRFRLLRQHGYNVPEDIFGKFKDRDGKFKEDIQKDIRGLMSLYEASHLRIPGDRILDDANEYSGKILHALNNVEQSNTGIIRNTLNNPCRKSLPRATTNNFLMNMGTSLKFLHDLSGNDINWIREIENIARINIHLANINHKNEITQVSRWWKGLRLTEELKLARNQPEIWHMWSLACLPSPDMAEQRIELSKAISFVYIIDDIFDVYGTLEELTLFTEAVNRREYDNFKGLPKYMTNCLKALHEVTNEMSKKTYVKQGWNPKEILQEMWAELCNAFLVEAKWFASGHTPSTGEYMKNGRLSSAAGIVSAYLFLLLDEGGNNRTNLLNGHPDIVSSVATIIRLSDDLGSGKDENQNGHDGSYIDCYMNEKKGVSAECAREHVQTLISDAWKSINETCMSSSPFSADFKTAALNLARMVPVMYSNDDRHCLPS